MTTLTAPAPAVAPTVPPQLPAATVTLTVIGSLSGCLGLAAVLHHLTAIGYPLVLAATAMFLAAVLVAVSAGQDGS